MIEKIGENACLKGLPSLKVCGQVTYDDAPYERSTVDIEAPGTGLEVLEK